MVKSKYSNESARLNAVGVQTQAPFAPHGTLDHNSINHVSVNSNTMLQRKQVMHTNIHPPQC